VTEQGTLTVDDKLVATTIDLKPLKKPESDSKLWIVSCLNRWNKRFPEPRFHPFIAGDDETRRNTFTLARRAWIQKGEFLSGKAHTLSGTAPHWARVQKTAHSL